jgi:cytochrome c oxidase subunit 4
MSQLEHSGGTDTKHGEHAHPGARQYILVAFVLTAVTAVEIAIFYMPGLKSVLVPTLLALSALKFGIVVGFYMHLKFDHPLFRVLFFGLMALGTAVILALMTLFHAFGRTGTPAS